IVTASTGISALPLHDALPIWGLAEFGRHHYVEAEAAFDEALRVENRRWVRRDLAAMLVRCAVRRGDYATAGTRFIELVAGDQRPDRKSTRLNSSHVKISYAVF